MPPGGTSTFTVNHLEPMRARRSDWKWNCRGTQPRTHAARRGAEDRYQYRGSLALALPCAGVTSLLWWRARTMRVCPVVLEVALAVVLLVPPTSSSAEDSGHVTLLTDDTFDAFIREHEFSMVEL